MTDVQHQGRFGGDGSIGFVPGMLCHARPQRRIKDLEEAVFKVLVIVYVAQYRRLMEVMRGRASIYRECSGTRSQTLVTVGSRSTDRDKSSGHSFALHCNT